MTESSPEGVEGADAWDEACDEAFADPDGFSEDAQSVTFDD